MLRIPLVTAVAALALAALATPAGAGEAVYNAPFCVTTSGSTALDANARLHPVGIDSAEIVCPVVNRAATSLWSAIEVVVYDRHYSDDVVCSTMAQGTSGTFYLWSTRSTEGSSSVTKTLAWGASAFGYADATILLACHLPGQYAGMPSSLIQYRVTQP